MNEHVQGLDRNSAGTNEGARAILRVPEILIAVALGDGPSFADIRNKLDLPKSSLHRLLRTLQQGGYLIETAGAYSLGPASVRLSLILADALPTHSFPHSAKPVLEWVAHETMETVMLAVPTSTGDEVTYVQVINSPQALRVTVPQANKRPLYAAASGQVILAFLSDQERDNYFTRTEFVQLTAETADKLSLSKRVTDIRQHGLNFDRNGSFMGASAIASPCFDQSGELRCVVAIAGPTDRLEQNFDRLTKISLEAGRRISGVLGYSGDYPPHYER